MVLGIVRSFLLRIWLQVEMYYHRIINKEYVFPVCDFIVIWIPGNLCYLKLAFKIQLFKRIRECFWGFLPVFSIDGSFVWHWDCWPSAVFIYLNFGNSVLPKTYFFCFWRDLISESVTGIICSFLKIYFWTLWGFSMSWKWENLG